MGEVGGAVNKAPLVAGGVGAIRRPAFAFTAGSRTSQSASRHRPKRGDSLPGGLPGPAACGARVNAVKGVLVVTLDDYDLGIRANAFFAIAALPAPREIQSRGVIRRRRR
ncbi:hypothetical protein GCM10023405_49930 [Streptomonospora salina]